MRRCFLGLAIILFATFFASGQEAKPQPTPPDDVVKITTNLIQVDVTVTDPKGKPVTDLKPEEIEIYENGQKQKITNFSFITGVRVKVEKPKDKEKEPLAIPDPPKGLRTEDVRRTFALVVDDLTLSFDSAYHTRRALKKFVDEQMQDGDLVAIIRTGAGIGALQQFTADKRMLYAAIEKVKWNPMGSGGISVFAPIEPPLAGQEQTQGSEDDGDDSAGGSEQSLDDFRTQVFATGTLGALRYVINGMSELPGRKSVVLFSHGFRLIESDTDGAIRGTSIVLDYMKLLVDQANRASVTFYAIDPRGLQYTGFTAADNTGGMSTRQMMAAMSARSRELNDTQDGLKYLARETGGFAVVNNNDINGAVRRVIEDNSYYLVAYDPDTDTFDPVKRRFNRLEVKVLRPGVKVRYRSGFFNVVDREQPVAVAATGQTLIQQLHRALVSPFAVNGINLRLNAIFGSDQKNVPFVRSLLHVDATDLKFTDEPNGEKKAVFDVLAVSFGDNGQVVDSLGKTYTIVAKPAAYKRMMEIGFVYHFVFPVKKAGAYQYRVAIKDGNGGSIGSASQFIEVPNLKKKRLTLSSLVIENLSADEWRKELAGQKYEKASDPMTDTAVRRVKQGSVIRYGCEIYNAKLDTARQPKLTTRIRVFRDGKMILDGVEKPFEMLGQTDVQHLKASGGIVTGAGMQPGDYILQVIVTDQLADKKKQIATQVIQFEVVSEPPA